MANTPSKDHSISDKEALKIAEQTDVPPRQAKELALAPTRVVSISFFCVGYLVERLLPD
jgi:hypothetical protein